MPHHHPFQESFWSPTASIDATPNFKVGFDVLHKKLLQSRNENKVIADYIKKRIASEKAYANTLKQTTPMGVFENDVGAGLKKCFEVVRAESEESSQEHTTRASNLHATALDPLQKFSIRYERIITRAKKLMEEQMNSFNTITTQYEQSKTAYITKAKGLQLLQPLYDPRKKEHSDILVEVGEYKLTRGEWMDLIKNQMMVSGKSLVELIQLKSDVDFTQAQQVVQLLIQKKCISSDEEEFDLESNYIINSNDSNGAKRRDSNESKASSTTTRSFSGFLGRWGSSNSNQRNPDEEIEKIYQEMMEADKTYRLAVKNVEKSRVQTEEALFMHYEEMESLELERIQTIKQVFVSMAASLSNTIPRSKETYDRMMLYQETLKPDKDVQFIVEQYRTGRFCPRPILYENYFVGTAYEQVFGVPLEEITKVQDSLVPPLISEGLSVIESGLSNLCDEEKSVVWTTTSPLDRVYSAREEMNELKVPITAQFLQRYDLLLLTSIIRLYLMELPECLFTFELYEPYKLLYANQVQDKDTRLTSISKLLATLPSCNYYTIHTLFSHFNKLVLKLKHDSQLSEKLSKTFSHTLIRPQVESNLSVHEHHPQRLIHDLIEHFDIIFTKESYKAQENHSNRPAMTANHIDTIILPKSSSMDSSNTTSTNDSTQSTNESALSSSSSVGGTRTSADSTNIPNERKRSILSFMRSSQSTPTTTTVTGNTMKRPLMPMPSASTLFEDPDELSLSERSAALSTPPTILSPSLSSGSNKSSSRQRSSLTYEIEELASLDSFFEDDD
ncbi:hypothetical protein K501DRAFT_333310 [Backusella circina FSU 941]|nr:hypothetical protein K501DRAFT_333310 [Backusella circina FSU 941]